MNTCVYGVIIYILMLYKSLIIVIGIGLKEYSAVDEGIK